MRKLSKNLSRLICSSILIFISIFVLGSLLPAPTSSATSPSANGNTDVNVTIKDVIAIRILDSTGTSQINSLHFNLTPIQTGISVSGSFQVDVATSNKSGYTLSMTSDYRTDGTSSGTSSSAPFTNALTPVENTVVTIPTSTTATTNYWNYSTSWNESLGPSGSETDYSGGSTGNLTIPTHETSSVIRSDVDTATDSSKTEVAININADTSIPAGVYKNKLVFTAIAVPNPVTYTVNFDENSGTAGTAPSSLQEITAATSQSFTIPNTTPTKPSYGFIGWSTSATERIGTGSGPDGLFVPGDVITLVADDASLSDPQSKSITLYAFYDLAWSSATISAPGTYLATGAVNPNRQVTITTTLDSSVTASDLGTISVTLGSSACTSPTLGTQNNKITITCTAPDLLSGDYTISVTSSKNTGTLTTTNGYHVIDALVDFTKRTTSGVAMIIQTGADNIVASAPNKQLSFTTISRDRSTGAIASHSSLAGYSNLGNNQSLWYRSSFSALIPSSGCYDIGYEIYDNGTWSAPVWLGGQYVCWDGTNVTLHAL